jgi:hypothetical protein
MIWLVWTVLHDTKVSQRDLSPGAEWGYQDRSDIAPVDE